MAVNTDIFKKLCWVVYFVYSYFFFKMASEGGGKIRSKRAQSSNKPYERRKVRINEKRSENPCVLVLY